MVVKILVFAALLTACTHHRPLNQSFADVEVGRWVTVETTSGGRLSAISVQTLYGIGYQEEGGGMIDPSAIRRVTDNRTLRGAGEGFLIAGGTGAVLGAILGFADGDDEPCSDHEWCILNMTAGEKAVFGGILLGGLSSIVGLAVGAVAGSDDVYEGTAGIAITPVGPPGSVAGATITF